MPAGSRQLSRREPRLRAVAWDRGATCFRGEARCTPRRAAGPWAHGAVESKTAIKEPEKDCFPLVKSARFGENLKRTTLALVIDPGSESPSWEELGLRLLHPTQIAIIETMVQMELALSPRLLEKLSTGAGIKLGHFAYHCKRLMQLGILEKVGSVTRRGAAESYYYFATDSERDSSFYYFLSDAEEGDAE